MGEKLPLATAEWITTGLANVKSFIADGLTILTENELTATYLVFGLVCTGIGVAMYAVNRARRH